MVGTIGVNDPQVRTAAVLHDIHGFAHVYDVLAIRSNLWVVGIFEAKDVAGDKVIACTGPMAQTTLMASSCRNLILLILNKYPKLIIIDGAGLMVAAFAFYPVIAAMHKYGQFGQSVNTSPRSISGLGRLFLYKKRAVFSNGPFNLKPANAYAFNRLFACASSASLVNMKKPTNGSAMT